MSRRRWVGILAGVTIFLAAFGAALAVTVFQVSREVESEIVLSGVEVLSDDNFGIYHDRDLTEPVNFMEFPGAALVHPFEGRGVEPVWVYVVNHSDVELTFIEPCRDIENAEGWGIAHIFADIYNLEGEWTSNTCERDVTLAPGEIVWAAVHINAHESTDPGRYPFAVVFGAVGEAEEPPPPARIAFHSDRDGNWEVYAMDADGSNQTNLTNNPANDRFPAWSPDGSSIAFDSDRDGNAEIYVMDADGSNQTNLTNNAAANEAVPDWSPDGTKVSFNSARGVSGEIYVMNADGSDRTNLTDHPADDFDAAWSPDGTSITFTSRRDDNTEIYVMNVDGSNQTRLTDDTAFALHPAWSADGSKISFYSNRYGNGEIYVMNADGSNQTRLTNNSVDEFNPDWSPDDAKIAFASDRNGNSDIYVMDNDGANQTRLTNNLANERSPAWSPGGVAP